MNNTTTVLSQTIFLRHPVITVTPMVGMIIATPDKATSVTNNTLKTCIPPKKALLMKDYLLLGN